MKALYPFCCSLVFILLQTELTFGNLSHQFSPNVRYHQPSNQSLAFNYSYINVKKLINHTLAYTTPLLDLEVTNKTKCVKECVKTEGLCKSINLRALIPDGYRCQILAQDIYTMPRNLVAHINSVHYVIAVSHFGFFKNKFSSMKSGLLG